jgi:hypothetical protein
MVRSIAENPFPKRFSDTFEESMKLSKEFREKHHGGKKEDNS